MIIDQYNGAGIYYIRNDSENIIYIGSSIHIKTRLKRHSYLLTNNKEIKRMQADYNNCNLFSTGIIYKQQIYDEYTLYLKEQTIINYAARVSELYNCNNAIRVPKGKAFETEYYQATLIDRQKIRTGTGDIDTRTLEKLCKALQCDVGDIMEYVPGEGS